MIIVASDALALLTALAAALGLLTLARRALPGDVRLLLLASTALLAFLALSNTLEWSGWSGHLDPYEDQAEMLLPVLLLASFYAWFQRQQAQERQELQARALQAQKLESLGLLAGGIAHDFNNLLLAMLGNADLALQEAAPGSEQRRCLEDVLRAGRRAAELTGQMLAYAGRGRLAMARLHLQAVVEEMLGLLRSSISKKAELHLEFSPGLPPVDADATQLRQVVMNLLTNASEALEGKPGGLWLRTGRVSLEAGHGRRAGAPAQMPEPLPPGDYVFLEVEDTGVGMDTAHQARIFEPFFTTKFTGRGLGLAATLGIARGHGGAIEVDSAPGRGTRMRVLLPPASQAPAVLLQASPPTPAATVRCQPGGLVLVIDDEAQVLQVTRLMLERLGYRVLEAADGQAGLRAFREHAAELCLVLLDLTLPGEDGDAVFGKLREIRPEVAVVATSSLSQGEVLARFPAPGPAAFLQKPYRLEQLAELVGTLAGGTGD
ncbi:MAG TPA: ATP-binding protein [Myxococcota bacterium]|nr:ATP-binding protein [Myxococcota bacterium]